jgi:uncharacterized iron-regulated membrane protein
MTRQILSWLHLGVGVVAGEAILILSATGVLLAFERRVLQLVDRDLRTVDAPADAPPAQRLRALVRFVHTGEKGGLAGQLAAAIATAAGGLLVWTGLSLALRRLRSARRNAERPRLSAELQQGVPS